eukprot:gene10557-387_t
MEHTIDDAWRSGEAQVGRRTSPLRHAAVRVASGEQPAGALWVKFICLLSALADVESAAAAALVPSLRGLGELVRCDDEEDRKWARHEWYAHRLGAAEEAARAGECYRGMCCGFDGGERIVDMWRGVAEGADVGVPGLWSTSLSVEVCMAFMQVDEAKWERNILFVYRGVPSLLRLFFASAYRQELECLGG